MHARIRPIHEIDVTAIIDLHVICLDSDFTPVLAGYSDASLGGILVDGGDVIANLDGVVGVANIRIDYAF